MILDVGCGVFFEGDVNCDLYLKDVGHRRGQGQKLLNIKNLVNCDCLHLPFPNNCFEIVTCNHLIEHLETPFNLIKELIRVSKYKVVIKCPHKLGDRMMYGHKYDKFHLQHFNKKWFYRNLLPKGYVLKIDYSRFLYFFIPLEMTVTIMKQKKRGI